MTKRYLTRYFGKVTGLFLLVNQFKMVNYLFVLKVLAFVLVLDGDEVFLDLKIFGS